MPTNEKTITEKLSKANVKTGAEAMRCGYVAIVGEPNAGKSTLLNALTGAKVSIVSHRPQTTRARMLGIAMHHQAQLCFLDTPGIFAPKKRLERAMVGAAWNALDEADAVVLVVDAGKRGPLLPDIILKNLKKVQQPVFLVLNKVDTVKPRDRLLPLAEQLMQQFSFKQIFFVSALKQDGVEDLKKTLAALMPEAHWLFGADQLTDVSERLLAAELTREQVFDQLYQELPYAVAVLPDIWERHRDGALRIGQTIMVERDSQKAIVLGEGGSRIKKIGALARVEIAKLLGCPVHLVLNVQVATDWQDKRDYYELFGLEFQ